MRFFYTTILLLLLTGCLSNNYEYIKKFNSGYPEIDEVIVVIEYLSLKDDIKGHWNFYEDNNFKNQEVLYAIASSVLKSKGYLISNKYLKSSGLIIDREFLADHYLNKELQERPISPPYIIRSMDLEDKNIMGIESLLFALNKPVTPVMTDLKPFINNKFSQEVSHLDLPENCALLIIQSYHPKVSPLLNIGFGIDSFSDPFVDFAGNNIRPTSFAYFVHKSTGDLLWSNKTSQISVKNQQKFFLGMPAK